MTSQQLLFSNGSEKKANDNKYMEKGEKREKSTCGESMCYGLNYVPLPAPANSYGETLTPSNSECDLIQRWCPYRNSHVEVRSLVCTIIQCDCCPQKKRKC